ncbi:MAG TPA: 5'/3'-nucleotidase SurE [Parachlamydiaceae bacterium]|nr:5'/3'-nucleotidase SurE [Parachlamydiaceae bacterium]
MKKRPKILITNDDGIHAPGIRHLWNALKDAADLVVCAPSTEQSAVALSISIRKPLQIQKIDWHAPIAHHHDKEEHINAATWAISGTPADCIKLGLNVIFENETPDLIVSGINRGTNAGRNVLYSGTVAGAIESVMHDIPAIAFSACDFTNPNYGDFEQYVPQIVEHVLKNPLPKGTLLNVNFPGKEHSVINGFRLTRQGKQFWVESLDKRTHPAEGSDYYWLGAKIAEFDEHHESDIYWLEKGYITAVPVHVSELTDHHYLSTHKESFEQLNLEADAKRLNELKNGLKIKL